MKIITVKFGQTIFDIALQEYGDLEGIKTLLEDNEGLDLSQELVEGSKLNISIDKIIQQPIVNEFLNK